MAEYNKVDTTYDRVKIVKNPDGDTRTASKDVTFEQFQIANRMHRADVARVMDLLSNIMHNNGQQHDWTKIMREEEFYRDFKDTLENGTDFVSGSWYQNHITEEAHHPMSKCSPDINLLDIVETVVDCVCAGLARSGDAPSISIDPAILQLAINNTVNLITEHVILKERDK